MRPENEHRLSWQLGLLLMFWCASNFTLIVQYNHLPPEPTDIVEQMTMKWNTPDPWTYYPLEYNPWNDRMTLIESVVIWLGMFYGLLRLINIMRIIGDDDKETAWERFWDLCETF